MKATTKKSSKAAKTSKIKAGHHGPTVWGVTTKSVVLSNIRKAELEGEIVKTIVTLERRLSSMRNYLKDGIKVSTMQKWPVWDSAVALYKSVSRGAAKEQFAKYLEVSEQKPQKQLINYVK